MLHAVIMAGGSGTRFWPVSRTLLPKQMLNLVGERTMIQATADRLGDLIPAERRMVVTNERLVDGLAEQLPDMPASSIVGEPCKRDTAPCVGLSAALVRHTDPEGIMVVLPADHVITATDVFRSAIQKAADFVEQHPRHLVTFGIRPTYPAESFGYIERGEPVPGEATAEPGLFKVTQFREKPSAEVAQQYLEAGSFYWNAGIFVWKAQTVLDALAEFEPEMYAHLQAIEQAIGTPDYQTVLEREFAAIDGKSIDYAIMERYSDVVVYEAAFDWDDLGSWQSLARLRGADSEGNTIVGRHLSVNSKGCIVRSSDEHLVATVGMEDCIVVHTPNATLVARKSDEEAIRKVVAMIKEQGWDEHL